MVFGSSPRARGTRWNSRCGSQYRRFIPAGAGNTCAPRASTSSTPVHPRGRGEHEDMMGQPIDDHGSSPRARGTPVLDFERALDERFIPAGAGNTAPPPSPATTSAVHPRGRGEHLMPRRWNASATGSSPRARGTHRRGGVRQLPERFIPAGAGNTSPPNCSATPSPVHPRGRGEHVK